MPNLKKQVLFSNGFYNPNYFWWTWAGKIKKNLFAIIYIKNLPHPKFAQKFLSQLKKKLNTQKFSEILKHKNISQNSNISIAFIKINEVKKLNKIKISLQKKGNIQAKLIQNKKILKLKFGTKILKGKIKQNEILVLHSDSISNLNFKNALLKFKKLKTLRQTYSKKNQAANFILFSYTSTQLQNFSLKKLKLKKIPKNLFKKINQKNHKTPNLFSNFRPFLIEKKSSHLSRKRFYALIVASVFLLLLGFSLSFGIYQKNQKLKAQKQQDLIENITYKLNQAESLKNLNPQRAKTLLKQAQDTLTSYQKNKQNININLKQLSEKVNSTYSQITQKYLIDQAEIFFDPSLIKSDLKFEKISLSNRDLTLFSYSDKNLISLNIETKSYQIFPAQSLISNEKHLASIDKWIILSSSDTLKIIDKQEKKELESFRLEKINISDLLGYSQNAYILDKINGQLWRLRSNQTTFQKPDSFFQDSLDLSQINSFALDGSLWFLYSDGGVEQYTSGIKDAYYPAYTFSLDEKFNNPEKIFTNEYCQNLYILDKKNHRIVVLSKNGKYIGQYIWENIEKISDFVVSEKLGKILILFDDKIYSIDIKN